MVVRVEVVRFQLRQEVENREGPPNASFESVNKLMRGNQWSR